MQQQGGADDGLGIGACFFQVVGAQTEALGQPQRGLDGVLHGQTLGQFGTVLRVAFERPLGQLRYVLVREALALVHAEVAVLRHGDELFQQLRAALGA